MTSAVSFDPVINGYQTDNTENIERVIIVIIYLFPFKGFMILALILDL